MSDPPRIEFPCEYPIKVIIDNDADAMGEVLSVIKQYYPEFAEQQAQHQPSSRGNYVSVRVQFWATGTGQLQAMFNDLKAISAVRMVL